jgi:hypothetical protein
VPLVAKEITTAEVLHGPPELVAFSVLSSDLLGVARTHAHRALEGAVKLSYFGRSA